MTTPMNAQTPDPTNERAKYYAHQKFATILRELRATSGANHEVVKFFLADTPHSQFVSVDKAMAGALLGWVLINRAIDERNMQMLTDAMMHDAWLTTGDSIQIDWRGNVFEGQHRLLAVYITGKTQSFNICWGLDPRCAHVAGDSKAKTNRDALMMADSPDSTRRAAWITAIEGVLGRKQGRVTRQLTVSYNAEFDSELRWMSALAPKARPWCRASVLAAFILAYRREPKKVERFAVKVLLGVGEIKAGSAAAKLRQYISAIGTEENSRSYIVTCTVLNGILAHITRKPVEPLGPTPEGLTYFTRYEGFLQMS